MSEAQWINWHNWENYDLSVWSFTFISSSHRGQTAPLLTYDGTATQEPGDHHQPPGQDQDVGGHGECAGGQQAQVLSFIHQRPDPNTHHHPAAYLKERITHHRIS